MDFTKYQNTMAYPRRAAFEKQYVSEFEASFFGTLPAYNAGLDAAVAAGKRAYEDALFSYRARERQLEDQFAQDLATEFGVHESMAGIVFAKAWQDGHSGGYAEVRDRYSELLDFVERIIGTEGITKGVKA